MKNDNIKLDIGVCICVTWVLWNRGYLVICICNYNTKAGNRNREKGGGAEDDD